MDLADVVDGLTLRPATAQDVDAVVAIYRACTAALLARGIRQWDDHYPDRATAADAVARGDLFLLVGRGVTIGAVVLNELAAPEYAPIVWREPDPALIIHALVIDPARHGGGLGRKAMACCEVFARGRGFACVRLDAYPGNAAAMALYERLGYARRGEVHFAFKPAGHDRYAVFEKRM